MKLVNISTSPRPFFKIITVLTIIMVMIACSSNTNTASTKESTDNDKPLISMLDSIVDVDGQVYPTVMIGDQTWMAEDLKKTEFECENNKQAIFTNGLERGPGVKLYVNEPRYAWYKNRQDHGFGLIYNYAVIQHCKICPPEYRIPTKSDWEKLIESVGGKSQASPVLRYNGEPGFSAKLGGRIDSYGSVLAGNMGFWWSSDMVDEFFAYSFEIVNESFVQILNQPIQTGLYVRCIKE